MNGDTDGSEYVDDDEHVLSEPDGRRRPTKAKNSSARHARVKSEPSREASATPEQSAKEARVKSNDIAKPETTALRAYRDLLNSEIADVVEPVIANSETLPPSQIGASCWTSHEKHKFFTALASHGSGNLPVLSGAIGTKSNFEVKAYILLLQEGVRELDVAGKRIKRFDLADAPAAAEITERCLDTEELVVAELDKRVTEQEEAREKERWGEESWLITEDADEAIEAESEDEGEKAVKSDDPEDRQPADAGIPSTPSSDQLLDPSAFLQLSQTIFMNSKDPEMNWRTVAEEDGTHPSPSMRRTAFDDFYNLTVSLTRRLVQASIFQALSRLRASSDPRVVTAVNRHDAEAAREIAGPKMEGRKYWADAVRRCGVEVYDNSKRFRADVERKGTKFGYRLTRHELETALGVQTPKSVDHTPAAVDSDEDDVSADEYDSDAYTIASSSDATSSDEADTETNEETVSRGRKSTPSENRKRPLSPTSYDRAERRYLETLDGINSTNEENNLRSILGMEELRKARSSKPTFHYKRSTAETRTPDWRETVQYEAPWEQPQGYPKMGDFERMQAEGARRRKRRRLNSDAGSKHGEEALEVDESDGSQQESEDGVDGDGTEDVASEEDEDGNNESSGDEAAEEDMDLVQSDEE
ncbi:hypothetical protein Q7P37_011327 [Cladosporium fusiforme]